MTDLNEMLETLEENERIARIFHVVESKILTILNFRDFFETLLSEIQERFTVPHVWVSIMGKSELADMIHMLEGSEIVKNRMHIVEPAVFSDLLEDSSTPLLKNEKLHRLEALMEPIGEDDIGSMAVVPILLDGEVMGGLNLADPDKSRFQPDKDASLLERLGLKVSLCLSNVTAHERVRWLAFHDPLTGVLNRRAMETVLKREFGRAKRYAGVLSVVFVDLDDFKAVNDIHGHERGDMLLKYVAGKMGEMCRESDVVSRYAGDEFVIILPETPRESAERLMERFQSWLTDHPLVVDDVATPAFLSFGAASTRNKFIREPADLLKKADERLYMAKKRAST